MISTDRERREHPRIKIRRPCKIYDPRSHKYTAGTTCDLSAGGMVLRLDRRVPFEPGDRVFVGIAQKRRDVLLRSDDMIHGEVVRALGATSDATALAVRFCEPAPDLISPILRAA